MVSVLFIIVLITIAITLPLSIFLQNKSQNKFCKDHGFDKYSAFGERGCVTDFVKASKSVVCDSGFLWVSKCHWKEELKIVEVGE